MEIKQLDENNVDHEMVSMGFEPVTVLQFQGLENLLLKSNKSLPPIGWSKLDVNGKSALIPLTINNNNTYGFTTPFEEHFDNVSARLTSIATMYYFLSMMFEKTLNEKFHEHLEVVKEIGYNTDFLSKDEKSILFRMTD